MTRLNIATTLPKFNNQVNAFAKTLLNEQLPAFTQKLAFDILAGVVEETPVLTGRARGNWQVSLGSPIESALEIMDQNGEITKAKGNAIIEKMKPFGVVYITNNLPYIEFLEEGTSDKAPDGMVAITLDRLGLSFEGAF